MYDLIHISIMKEHGEDMSITGRIQANYSKLTRTECKIADYILEHSPEVAFKTLEEIANCIEVSTTSVIRFARTLEYEGYTQMQQSIQQSLMKKVSLPERYDESYSFLKKNDLLKGLLDSEIENLRRSVELLDEESMHKAVEAINQAQKVYVLGARSTFGLAHYMTANLSQIRNHIYLVSGTGGMYPEEIVGAGSGDVCLAYMFPRYQKMISNLLSWMKSKGVKVILITTPPYDTIRHLGDVFLCCSLQSGVMMKDSMVPAMFISNYLFNCISADDYQRTRSNLEEVENLLDRGFYFGV